MDDVAILLSSAGLVALPGLAGYVLAGWRMRGSVRRWRPWLGWAVPTLGAVVFWMTCWLWSRSMYRQRGLDDGSVAMSFTALVSTVAVNAVVGAALLAWNRRKRSLSQRAPPPGARRH